MTINLWLSYIKIIVLALPVLIIAFPSIADEAEIEEVEAYGEKLILALPVKALDRAELDKAEAANMTKMLQKLPGINNASYGEAVGRPVIRGLSANRVKLSVNGATNADVSAMSADHAPMMEIINADEVEVIFGPNTLRFGNGAMGGLVNINDGRFHNDVMDGIEGRILASYGSNANTGQGALVLDVGKSNQAGTQAHIGHIDLLYRQADNYATGETERDETVPSTSSETAGGAVSYNFIASEKAHLGVAFGYADYAYGLPNDEDIDAKVTPKQSRFDLQGSLFNIGYGINRWETKLSYIDYQHEELLDSKPEALFEKKVTELQSTLFFNTQTDWQFTTGIQFEYEDFALCHDHGGCPEIPDYSSIDWDGSKGVNLINDTFAGFNFNHSTPMPLTKTLDTGVYFIAGKTFDIMTAELGLRYESSRISLDPNSILPSYRRDSADYNDVVFQPLSLSAGFSWDLAKHRVAVNISHSERAPAADEMFYNGDHHATFSYQLDNIDLNIESANSVDLTWQLDLEAIFLSSAVFYYDFSDYIYNDIKAVKDPYHGRDVYRYEQADAWFTGGEISIDIPIGAEWLFFTNLDYVRAKLKQGDNTNLPRIPPMSMLAGLQWQSGPWDIEAHAQHHFRQDKTASNETTTDSYTVVNTNAAYRLDLNQSVLTLQLKVNNLLNEYGLNHTSYLKSISPVQGRNIALGFIIDF